jgi:hypothetical protein
MASIGVSGQRGASRSWFIGGAKAELLFDLSIHVHCQCITHPLLQEVVVLEAKSARAATAEILEAHSIPAAVSKDLADLLPEPVPQPEQIPTVATISET